MKIVICRGSAFGGYPSEEQLQTYWKELLAGVPDLQITMRGGFNSAQADEIAGDNEALIGAWIGDDVFTASFFDRHPNLKYVSTYAHGFGRFDHEAAAAHGVTFTNTVYGDETIAEFAMSLLLSICHHPEMEAAYYHDELAKGRTLQSLKTRQIELYEKTMGIIGLGRIGLRMAEMAHAFGMNRHTCSKPSSSCSVVGTFGSYSCHKLFSRAKADNAPISGRKSSSAIFIVLRGIAFPYFICRGFFRFNIQGTLPCQRCR